MTNKTEMHGWYWLAVVILLATAAFGARGLDADALWDDEIHTYKDAGAVQYGDKTPAEVWQTIAVRAQDQAPGYSVGLSVWTRAVGWSEFSARVPSLLFGLMAVALVYRLGAIMISPRVGALAAAVLGSSAFFIHYTHEVRAFAVGMAFAALVLLCYWRLIGQRDGRVWPSAIGLVVGALGVLHSHYFIALILPLLAVYHLGFAPKDRRWWLPVGLGVPVIVLFAPQLPIFLTGVDDNSNREALHRMALSPQATVLELLTIFGNGYAVLALIMCGGALLTLRQAENRSAKVFVLFMGIGLGLVVVGVNGVARLLDPGRQRYFAGAWPALALSAALVFDWLWSMRRGVGAVALASWVAVGVWAMRPEGLSNRFDGAEVAEWRAFHDIVERYISEDDVIALHSPGLPWLAIPYFRHYTALFPARAELIESLETEAVMQDYVANTERVWLTIYERYPSEPLLMTFDGVLEDDFVPCYTWNAPEFDIQLLARSPVFCPGQPLAQFTDGPALTGFTVDDRCADATTAYLGWQVPEGFSAAAYSFGLYVLDAERQVVAQADAGLPSPIYGYQRQPLTLTDINAGTYTVGVGVYAWQTGERLLLTDGNPLAEVGTLAVDDAGCAAFSP